MNNNAKKKPKLCTTRNSAWSMPLLSPGTEQQYVFQAYGIPFKSFANSVDNIELANVTPFPETQQQQDIFRAFCIPFKSVTNDGIDQKPKRKTRSQDIFRAYGIPYVEKQ